MTDDGQFVTKANLLGGLNAEKQLKIAKNGNFLKKPW